MKLKNFLKTQLIWIIILIGTILMLLFKLHYLTLVKDHKEIHHIMNPHILGIYTALSLIPILGATLHILHKYKNYNV